MLRTIRERLARATGCRLMRPPITLADVHYCGCREGEYGTDAELAPVLAEYERSGGWVAEPKLDGMWAQVDARGARSRTGRPIDVPALPRQACTLVGEYVQGTIHAFDILTWGPADYRPLCRTERRFILAAHCGMGELPASYRLAPQWHSSFAAHMAEQPEGLILKAVDDGPYHTGRNANWRKVKRCRTYDCVARDWRPGLGGSGSIGLAQLRQDGSWQDCGRLALHGPDANAIGRACAVAAEPLVVELRAFGQYLSGAFRSPELCRVRTDKRPADCRAFA